MLLAILLTVFALTAFDEGGVGRTLRRWLTQAPARWLARLSRGQVLGLAAVALLGWAAVTLFEAEGIRLFAMAAPDMIGGVMMFDATVVFDLAVLAVGLRAVAGWRALARQADRIARAAPGVVRRVATAARTRSPRVRPPRSPRAGSDDAEPRAVFA